MFLAQFQYNSSHDVSTQCLVYVSTALIWAVFICSSVSMGFNSYPIYTHVYHEDGGSCFFTFHMFPPTVTWCLHTTLSVSFCTCSQMDCFYLLQSVWDTLHFLYRHYVYHEDGGSCFFIFQMFPPTTVFGTAIQKKKKSLRSINLQCHKDFLGNESGESQLTVIPD
jgi:hypothetical protein